MIFYAVTINPAKAPASCTKEHLDEVLTKVMSKATHSVLTDRSYEINELKHLHLHCTLYMRSNQYIKRLQVKGYQVDVRKLKYPLDHFKWTSYVYKHVRRPFHMHNKHLQEAVLQQHYVYHNNCFREREDRSDKLPL